MSSAAAGRPTDMHTLKDGLVMGESPRWHDIVVDAAGNAYVGCTGFDFPGGEFAPGSIARVTPDGAVREVADGVAFPNGVAITPDGATLVLAESYGNRLTAWDIDADGRLSDRRVWADLGDGVPDGICCDGEGLTTVDVDRGCFACMLGGADGRTLHIVASEWRGPTQVAQTAGTGQVLTLRAPAAHAGRP